ncbi:11948_t:CDS:2, partial [Funneliformis caledonium]
FLDNRQYFVLCDTKKQLQAFSELTYIEIDMTFKRIHSITNEWEVSVYSTQSQKTLTFVQVFTNVETAEAYQNLFEDLFSCIEMDIGKSFNFYQIHGNRLGC